MSGENFPVLSHAIYWGSALRARGFQWAPQGGAANFSLMAKTSDDTEFSETQGPKRLKMGMR